MCIIGSRFTTFTGVQVEEGAVPVLMELRRTLFSILARESTPRLEYKFQLSGLVDLTMFYFNYVDGKQF